MLLINNILYFENKDLIDLSFSSNTIQEFDKIRNPNKANSFLYDYDKIAQRSSKTREKLPSKEKLLATLIENEALAQKEEQLNKELALVQAWSTYLEPLDTHWFSSQLNETKAQNIGKKIRDLGTCMAILRMMHSFQTKAEVQYFTGFGTKEELILGVSKYIERENLYGLPCSYDRLRKKYYQYKRMVESGTDGRFAVIPGTFGNKNPEVFNEEHKALIKYFYMQPHKPSKQTAYDRYVEQCGFYQMRPVSLAIATNYLNSEYNKTVAKLVRDGKQAYEVEKQEQAKRVIEHSLSLITGDGWQAGHPVTHTVYRINKKTGKQEVEVITKRMTVWVWFDAKSKAIISHEISSEENSAAIRKSLRTAIRVCGNKIPLMAMMDKRWTLNPQIKETLYKLGIQVQPKRAYNPKSNIAERNNKELNKFHRMVDEYWVNMTNGHSTDNRHNPEHVRKAEAFTYQQFAEMIHQIVALYNTQYSETLKGTPADILLKKMNPDAKTLDELQKRWAFANTSIVTVNNGVVKLERNKQIYEYRVPNWTNFLKQNIKSNRVRVYFDEDLTDSIDLYRFADEEITENDLYLCTCDKVEYLHAATVEQTEQDKAILGDLMHRQTKLTQSIENDVADTKQKVQKLTGYEHINVLGTTQERHKQADDNEFMRLYNRIHSDFEDDEFTQTVVVDKVKKPTVEQKKKHYDPDKMKKLFNDL